MERKIALIDLDSLCFVFFHPKKVLDRFGTPLKEDGKFVYVEKTEEEITSSVDSILSNILEFTNSTHYIAIIKGERTIDKKLAVNPDYKANRTGERPKWLDFTKAYLLDSWKAYEAHDYEVDDYILSLKKYVPDSFICAIDSDILKHEGTHYNWKSKLWITTSKEEENIGFWSEMICGNHNNVKGIPKKGIKYCEKLFEGITDNNTLATLVFHEYLVYFGEEGPKEFCKNFYSIKHIEVPETDLLKMPPIEV